MLEDDSYFDDFENAPMMANEIGEALMFQEYNRCLGEHGSWSKLQVGDTVILKSMFLGGYEVTIPPWAVQESIIIEPTILNSKVMINTIDGIKLIWVPNFSISDHIPNSDPKIKEKFELFAKAISLKNTAIPMNILEEEIVDENYYEDSQIDICNKPRSKKRISKKSKTKHKVS